MKYFLILAFITTVLAFSSNREIQLKWNNFKKVYQKTYTKHEDMKRMEIFQENVRKIEKHNKLFEENKVTYKMSINQFTDMTSKEFLQNLNTRKVVTTKYRRPSGSNVPEQIDWREKGAVTPVKNENTCASWAFGVVGSLEGQNFLTNGKLVALSDQELADCVSGGCTGGSVEAGYEYVKENGIAAAKDYPSDVTNGTCRRGSVPSTVEISDYVFISGDEEALKEAVATIGPISVEVDATSWAFYTGGILKSQDCTSVPNHVVLVVGYGTLDGADYWLIKNSWGVNWGEEGYIKLARNTDNNCGITSHPSYPVL
ncbi:procathepsin L-like [Tribolium madens]|uniref:procathepsin L-like n=1 Tax=Tribolium madens TaxID=41895 RepID=UPI001CF72FE4|nr:procathepsin L-like [Tribolium madens]